MCKELKHVFHLVLPQFTLFYFLIPIEPKAQKMLSFMLQDHFLKIAFFSLSDLGLDQFIVKRYDGKVSTSDHTYIVQ